MKCIAIDDQPLALDIIEEFVSKIPFLSLERKCTSAMEAIEFLKFKNIDLIFLDINMPKVSGIEMIKIIRDHPMIIITTAYPEYALDGFDLKVVDYLIKPIRFERFCDAVNHANELYFLKSKYEKENAYMLVNIEYSIVKIFFNDILFLKGLKDYVQIFTDKKKFITVSTMKSMEIRLSGFNFQRVHKSYIVNINKIEKIGHNSIKILDNIVPIGSKFKKDFLEKLHSNE